MNRAEETRKLIHDLNSDLSSLAQAVEIICDNWQDDEVLVEKMLPLTSSKAKEVLSSWEGLKKLLQPL